jgi:hypothetical protein
MLWPGEVDYLASQQVDTMPDLCRHLVRSETQTSTGATKITYTEQLLYQCGLDPGSSAEVTTHGTTVVTDAFIRLPLGSPVKLEDRIKMVSRFGKPLNAPITYYIISEPMIGPTAVTCNLKEITL